jgi:predicted nucleic acid-binding Zn ribbon protein
VRFKRENIHINFFHTTITIFQKIEMLFDEEVKDISRTTTAFQMATMKKATKAAAVKKGTYYECGWCGQEGTNARYRSEFMTPVCGRLVAGKTNYFCSKKCRHMVSAEHNRREVIGCIDYTNEVLDTIKSSVAYSIKHGEKIDPVLLQVTKLINIYKKVLTLIVSGDKPSARKLYDEKKAIVTDCAEDVLADEYWAEMYMFFINKFAEVDGMMNDECSF